MRAGSSSIGGRLAATSAASVRCLGLCPERVHRVGREGAEISRLFVQHQAAGVSQDQGSKILDEPVQRLGGIEDGGEMCRIARIDAIRDRLRLSTNHSQRRAKLVRQLRQEAAALLVAGLQPRRHLVEGPGDGPQVSQPSLWHLDRVVAGLDPARRIDQAVHRPGHPPRGAGGGRDQERDEHDRQHRDGPSAQPSDQSPDDRPRQHSGGEDRDEKAPDPAHELGRPSAAPASRGEGFAFRPPGRPAARRRAPAASHHSRGSANR
jgi:hypothetical protein